MHPAHRRGTVKTMMTRNSKQNILGMIFIIFMLCPLYTFAQVDTLTQLKFNIVGVKLQVDPPRLTVPKDIPSFINASLTLPDGADAATQSALAELY